MHAKQPKLAYATGENISKKMLQSHWKTGWLLLKKFEHMFTIWPRHMSTQRLKHRKRKMKEKWRHMSTQRLKHRISQ